jgi:hypothetical protein
MSTRSAAAAVLLVIAASSCQSPRIVERSPTACSNGIDDDGDGSIDCADSDCHDVDTCERSAATCANDKDDDGDGEVDCEQESCRAGGFCETFAADCTFSPQSGCPRGMGCYDTGVGTGKPTCALPGTLVERQPCAIVPNDISGGCAIGYACDGVCYRYCKQDADCPRSSACTADSYETTGAGICTLFCLPPDYVCPLRNMQCISLSYGGLHYVNKGSLLVCSTLPYITPGTLRPGEPCVYPGSSDLPPDKVCEPTSLCRPEPCSAPERGDERRCTGGSCVPIDPFDQRVALPPENFLQGLCLP